MSSSTNFGRIITRQSVFHRSWFNTRHCCTNTGEAARSPAKPKSETEPFESLGLGVPFIQALQMAFPRVKAPTDIQTQLIPAILGKQDILLKNVTGSGKSFGLVLGLINKPGLVPREGKEVERHRITTILLVPHRDLAFQLYRWIEQITKMLPRTRIASLAYVLVRGTGVPMKTQMKRLEEKPPHILICTPQALMDAYKEKREALKLSTLSTIVVDEVDHRSYKLAYEKGTRKVPRYPGPTRQFLDIVYSKWEEKGTVWREWKKKTPQLILSSPTLGRNLKNYLFESGWLNKDNLVEIFRDCEQKKNQRKGVDKTKPTGKQGTVLHPVLVDQEYEKTP